MTVPHPDFEPVSVGHWCTRSTSEVTSGPVLVGIDDAACIVIWFPRDTSEFTVTDVDGLIEALNVARTNQEITTA